MTGSRALLKVLPALVLIALALPASASAQATRTWVSGVGDDANPCSRTAPCKTFAGAISKTAAKGEINCLDPGGFGGVTITKSLTIKCHYTEGGVLVSGTNAIVINAATTDRITLRGLDINGIGTGLNGIRILQARSVKILDTEIYQFVRNAIDVSPNTGTTVRVNVANSHLHDVTGNGILYSPVGSATARSHVTDTIVDDNGCGITGTDSGHDPAFNFAANCGIVNSAAGTATVNANVIDSVISENANGVLSNGTTSTVRVGLSDIVNNTTGFAFTNGGVLQSWGDNYFGGNTNNGASSAPAIKGKRSAK